MKNITIKNINELLKLNLSIPSYQRPYTWSFKSIQDLYDDINHAYEYFCGWNLCVFATKGNTFDSICLSRR